MSPFCCLATAALVALIASSLAVPTAHAVTIDWVTVGDPGNTADTTGNPNPAGAVADSFQIMKFEFTNAQYTDFLNAVDPNGANPKFVYNFDYGLRCPRRDQFHKRGGQRQ